MSSLGVIVITGGDLTLIIALALPWPAELEAVHIYSPSSFMLILSNLKVNKYTLLIIEPLPY